MEATAVLLGAKLRDLGQVDYQEAILAILWVMLKLSRAMVLASYVGFVWGVKCKDRSNILGRDWGQVPS